MESGMADRKLIIQRAKTAYQLLDAIFEFYGCQHCSLCCRAYTPVIQKREIESLSHYLKIKPKRFKRKYCNKLNLPLSKYELKAPCPFIDGKICTVYSLRPSICKLFPFELDPRDCIVRLVSIEVCPTATLIYYDLLDFHARIKHLLPVSKEEEREVAETIDRLEKMFVDKRKEKGICESTGGQYAVLSLMQWYFFALDRIDKVDDIEERVKSYYEKQKVKQEVLCRKKSD